MPGCQTSSQAWRALGPTKKNPLRIQVSFMARSPIILVIQLPYFELVVSSDGAKRARLITNYHIHTPHLACIKIYTNHSENVGIPPANCHYRPLFMDMWCVHLLYAYSCCSLTYINRNNTYDP